jgi:hypothetical protein
VAGFDAIEAKGALLISAAVQRAEGASAGMGQIEALTDADLEEAESSRRAFHDVEEKAAPLGRFLDFWHALRWIALADEEKRALNALFDGAFGDPIAVAGGLREPELPPNVDEGTLALFGAAADDETRTFIALDSARQLGLLKEASATLTDYLAIKNLLDRAHTLAGEERFLHWQLAFPRVWSTWTSSEREGGFDAVIGNPPWDRMKMQEVEWFAAHAPEIARQPRAADRKRMIEELQAGGDPLAADYDTARRRAETAARLATRSGAYPLLGRGDVNIYSLFVERAQQLVRPEGMVGLVVPVGVCTDKNASPFFKGISSKKRLSTLLIFENRRGWLFPDVHHEDKPTIIVTSGPRRQFAEIDYAAFIHSFWEPEDPQRRFSMNASGFARVNPNTGTAPLFRFRASGQIVTEIYARMPVLEDASSGDSVKSWPVKYFNMFHMTNDSHLFWTRAALEEAGAYEIGLSRWRKGNDEWLPLYEGKSIEAFNHRYASITTSQTGVSGQGVAHPVASADLQNPSFVPLPRYWIRSADVQWRGPRAWGLGFRDTTNVNNDRTAIFSLVPKCGAGNTLPLLHSTNVEPQLALCANGNAFVLDYVARRKIQSRHLNKYILDQLPVVPPADYDRRFGPKTGREIVADHVLRLSYTAQDMQPFARDMGYNGPPFHWDEKERRHLRARLDALYFHLYGVTDEEDVRFILSTFPIVERKDREAHGCYLTAELIVWYMRALAAGDAEPVADESVLIRAAQERERLSAAAA